MLWYFRYLTGWHLVANADEVVGKLLDGVGGRAGLDGLGVVGDKDGLGGLDDHDAFPALR